MGRVYDNGDSEYKREKYEQAIEYLSASNPIDDDYPLLKVISDVRGVDMLSVADGILEERKKWLRKITQEEKHFQLVLKSIESAGTVSKIREIFDDKVSMFQNGPIHHRVILDEDSQ